MDKSRHNYSKTLSRKATVIATTTKMLNLKTLRSLMISIIIYLKTRIIQITINRSINLISAKLEIINHLCFNHP